MYFSFLAIVYPISIHDISGYGNFFYLGVDKFQINYYYSSCTFYFDAWLSLVERCVRDAEVAGSNPVASIIKNLEVSYSQVFLCFTLLILVLALAYLYLLLRILLPLYQKHSQIRPNHCTAHLLELFSQ